MPLRCSLQPPEPPPLRPTLRPALQPPQQPTPRLPLTLPLQPLFPLPQRCPQRLKLRVTFRATPRPPFRLPLRELLQLTFPVPRQHPLRLRPRAAFRDTQRSPQPVPQRPSHLHQHAHSGGALALLDTLPGNSRILPVPRSPSGRLDSQAGVLSCARILNSCLVRAHVPGESGRDTLPSADRCACVAHNREAQSVGHRAGPASLVSDLTFCVQSPAIHKEVQWNRP